MPALLGWRNRYKSTCPLLPWNSTGVDRVEVDVASWRQNLLLRAFVIGGGETP